MILGALLAAAALAATAPADRATLVLVRALSYDRALGRRSGELRIAVVHPEGDARVVSAVGAVLDGLREVTVAGRPVGAWKAEPATGGTPWRERLAGYDAVLLAPGVGGVLIDVVAAARELDVATLALDPTFVGRGASLGVDQRGSRLQILVDRAEASAEGADLSGELLEMAVEVAP